MITSSVLEVLAPRADAELWAPRLSEAAERFEINTPARVAQWLAQILHESAGLTRLSENLNYSADRLVAVWPKRFMSTEFAAKYARNPERLANFVYALRNGNGTEESGDGWKYRARGPIGITGLGNYVQMGEWLGLDLKNHPELLEMPEHGAASAACWWQRHGLNDYADADSAGAVSSCTLRINGALTGLADRLDLWRRARPLVGSQL